MYDKIKEFERIIKEEGVSQQLVSSFESLVGSKVITKEININKFTKNNSNIFKDHVLGCVQDQLREIEPKRNFNHTTLDVLELANDIRHKIDNVICCIKECKNGLSNEFWERAFNEKYAIRYDSETDEFINQAKERTVYTILTNGYEYVTNLINANGDTKDVNWRLNRINEKLDRLRNDTVWENLNGGYYPLLNLLKSDSLASVSYAEWNTTPNNIDIITMYSMCEILTSDKILESLEYLYNDIKRMSEDLRKGTRNFDLYSHHDSDEKYEKLMNIKNVFTDEISVSMLEIFKYFTNK